MKRKLTVMVDSTIESIEPQSKKRKLTNPLREIEPVHSKERRMEFCSTYGTYGSTEVCYFTDPISFHHEEIVRKLSSMLSNDAYENGRKAIKTDPYAKFYNESYSYVITGCPSLACSRGATGEKGRNFASFLELFFYIINKHMGQVKRMKKKIEEVTMRDDMSFIDDAIADLMIGDEDASDLSLFDGSSDEGTDKVFDDFRKDCVAELFEDISENYSQFGENEGYLDDLDNIEDVTLMGAPEDVHYYEEDKVIPPPPPPSHDAHQRPQQLHEPVIEEEEFTQKILSCLEEAKVMTNEWQKKFGERKRKDLDPSPFSVTQGTRGQGLLSSRKRNSKISPSALLIRCFSDFVTMNGGIRNTRLSKFTKFCKLLLLDAVRKSLILKSLLEVINFDSQQVDFIKSQRKKFQELIAQASFCAMQNEELVIMYMEHQCEKKASYGVYLKWLQKKKISFEFSRLRDLEFDCRLWRGFKEDKEVFVDEVFLNDLSKITMLECGLKRKKKTIVVRNGAFEKVKEIGVGTVADIKIFTDNFWKGYKRFC